MEPVKSYLPSNESKQKTNAGAENARSRKTNPSRALPSEWVDRLWERMTAMYGHKWVSAHGACDDGTWAAGLHGLTAEEIAQGLTLCLKREDVWPPSLPEFRAMCKRSMCAAHEERRALPAPRNNEVAASAIAGIKSALANVVIRRRPQQ